MRNRFSLLLLALIGLSAACDNPTKPETHEDPAGVAIYQGTTEITRSLGGPPTAALPSVAVGGQTAVLTVVFLDDHGHALDLSGESDIYLRVRVADGTKAGWQGTGYTGRFTGLAQGQTTVEFDLMHGQPPSGGHPDFTSVAFDLTVTP